MSRDDAQTITMPDADTLERLLKWTIPDEAFRVKVAPTIRSMAEKTMTSNEIMQDLRAMYEAEFSYWSQFRRWEDDLRRAMDKIMYQLRGSSMLRVELVRGFTRLATVDSDMIS